MLPGKLLQGFFEVKYIVGGLQRRTVYEIHFELPGAEFLGDGTQLNILCLAALREMGEEAAEIVQTVRAIRVDYPLEIPI
jgi:hypothetical protein